MLMVRSPLRITLGGGGTDLNSYAVQHGGFCISAAINKYSYVLVNRLYYEGISLKYSKTQFVNDVKLVEHPVIREAIRIAGFKTPQLEIVSVADVPSNGAGLGNSGAFTTSIVKALFAYKNIALSQEDVAAMACTINMTILEKTQGAQDEYISSLGGIRHMAFDGNNVIAESLALSHDTLMDLEENLMLFYTGFSHDTQSILNWQEARTNQNDEAMIKNLNETKDLGVLAYIKLINGETKDFGYLLNHQWTLKEQRMPEGNQVKEFLHALHYDLNKNGAIGNKLVGSGMGGFTLLYAEDKNKVREFMKKKGLEELRFNFDFEGCKRIV